MDADVQSGALHNSGCRLSEEVAIICCQCNLVHHCIWPIIIRLPCSCCGPTLQDSGVVVGGEYGISVSMFKNGYSIATLFSCYARNIDWSDPQRMA